MTFSLSRLDLGKSYSKAVQTRTTVLLVPLSGSLLSAEATERVMSASVLSHSSPI